MSKSTTTIKGNPTAQPELSTPEQKPAVEGSFLLKYKEVKRWASELPVANIGATARETYKTLVAFNRVEMPSVTRAEITELFREPVRYINSNMSRHYVDVGFPLSQKAFQASQLTTELCNEMANSYKIIIKGQLDNSSGETFDQNLVVIAIHRAMQYMGQSIFHSYLVYGEYEPGMWREIHYLYAWAVQNHIQDIPVKESNKLHWRKKNHSIEDIYKGYLLLSTIAPHRLRQSQIRLIHGQIAQWAKLTKIRAINEVSHSSGIFYVNLWSDNPPLKALSQNEKTDSRYRAFDLNEILSQTRADYEQSSWESPTDIERDKSQLPKSLLRLLIRGWNKSLQRKFTRTQLKLKLEIVVGLNNLYRVLQAEKEPLQQEKEQKHRDPTIESNKGHLNWNDSVFSTLAVPSPVDSQQGDSIFSDSVSASSTLLGDSQMSSWTQPPVANIDDLFSVLTYNESTEGYCLDWKGDIPPRVRVGDVLGFRSDKTPGEHGVSVVRWLHYQQKDQLLIGIQIISAQCSLAHITETVGGMGKNRKTEHCLLLTGNGVDNDLQGIITNAKTYKLDIPLLLITDFGEHKIKLTNWAESSNSFIQYDFEYVEDRKKDTPMEEKTVKDTNENKFEGLWNDL